jgi:hypothetical protein
MQYQIISRDAAKNGELEYMIILPTDLGVDMGYIKGKYSFIKRDDKLTVHDFIDHSGFILSVNNINVLHEDLNKFIDNVGGYLKTIDLTSCWP